MTTHDHPLEERLRLLAEVCERMLPDCQFTLVATLNTDPEHVAWHSTMHRGAVARLLVELGAALGAGVDDTTRPEGATEGVDLAHAWLEDWLAHRLRVGT